MLLIIGFLLDNFDDGIWEFLLIIHLVFLIGIYSTQRSTATTSRELSKQFWCSVGGKKTQSSEFSNLSLIKIYFKAYKNMLTSNFHSK